MTREIQGVTCIWALAPESGVLSFEAEEKETEYCGLGELSHPTNECPVPAPGKSGNG